MKVLFCASESVPFIKTGGLGDVIGSLPRKLKDYNIDVRIIIPKYIDIPEKYRQSMVLLKRFSIQIGDTNQYCGIEYLDYDGMKVYLVDNEYYFKRPGLYGYWDDGERFSFFSKAILESLPYIDFKPDIIHCHDWHTAMVNVLLKIHYKHHFFYENIKSIFTIHNLQYQGVFPRDILKLLNIADEYITIDGLEFYNQVNFMKGAIAFSDIITTVSKTYAREIQTEQYGERLEGILQKRNSSLYGIINGLDYQEYNPRTDCKIFQQFDENSLDNKLVNKSCLQKHLGLKETNAPLISLISRLVYQKGLDLISSILEDILQDDIQFVVLGTGEENYEFFFKQLAKKYPGKFSANIFFDDTLAHRIYASSDFFIMPSRFEPCGLGQLIALRYGAIPIVRETGGLKDTIQYFNELTKEGNGFTFEAYDPSVLRSTIKKAVEMYSKPYFSILVKQALMENFSWDKSANEYNTLYKNLV